MNDIIQTLEFIKNNPQCDSLSLDFDIVDDLHDYGYIKGDNTSVMRQKRYEHLRITIKGENHLLSLHEVDRNKGENHAIKRITKIIPEWIGKIIIGVIVFIITFYLATIL